MWFLKNFYKKDETFTKKEVIDLFNSLPVETFATKDEVAEEVTKVLSTIEDNINNFEEKITTACSPIQKQVEDLHKSMEESNKAVLASFTDVINQVNAKFLELTNAIAEVNKAIEKNDSVDADIAESVEHVHEYVESVKDNLEKELSDKLSEVQNGSKDLSSDISKLSQQFETLEEFTEKINEKVSGVIDKLKSI